MNFTDFKFLDLSKPQKFKYLQNSFFLKNAIIKKTQQNPLARTKRSVLLWYWGKFIHVKEVTIIMQNIIFRKKIFEKFKSFQPLATTRWIQECHWNIFRITWAIILPAFYFRRVLSSRALYHQRNLIGCVRGWSILNSAWLI